MKKTLLVGTTLSLMLGGSVASAATVRYTLSMSGAQETPAVAGTGTGTATLTFDDATRKLTGTITFSGLTGPVNAAHIHKGACGASGPNPYDLKVGNSPLALKKAGGTDVEIAAGDVAELAAGRLYVNFHTSAHGSGEIRGQLFPEGSGMTCPAAPADAGADAAADAGSVPDSGGSSSGEPTETPDEPSETDAGKPPASGGSSDKGGCSTTGAPAGTSLAVALFASAAALALTRQRRRR